MESPPEDIFHVLRDEAYLRQLQAEAEHWDAHSETLLSRTPPPAVRAYLNERLAGDSERQWFEVIGDFGSFRRGCVLGAGPGRVESSLLNQHPRLHLTVYDISGESLARLRERMEREFPGRFDTREEDLNFVTLPAEAYDLVVANSCLHHLVNLEHVAFQVNRCLTRDGHLFMQDAVAESRFQFSEEKKRLFEAYVDASRTERDRPMPIRWPDLEHWTYSPFESVRSGEILEILGRYLQEERVRTANALLGLTLFGRPQLSPALPTKRLLGPRRLLRAAAALWAKVRPEKPNIAREMTTDDLLFVLDGIFCDTGYLKPGIAFAIYKKRVPAESAEQVAGAVPDAAGPPPGH
jgi:SAM-dependent methyltransferase